MNRRSGLKRIYADFDTVQKKLEAVYKKYEGNEKVMGGIVGIWARMCADSILRNRVVAAGKHNTSCMLIRN